MKQTEEERLVEEYAGAAREHNERRMELIGAQLDALRSARKPGRPVMRQGSYRRITLEISTDLLAEIDASGKTRRQYIEDLMRK